MCNLLDGLVALGCTGMHYAMRDVKDMGQQMGYHSLEWNWPKEAIPIWQYGQELFMEPSC